MRQPAITKNKIICTSSILFNTQGYQATSLKDITEATEITKGAIYKHFQNKEALELASFDHQAQIIQKILIEKIKSASTAADKLRNVLDFFQHYSTCPPIQGGCPLLNTAIEVDEKSSPLRTKAIELYKTFINSITHIIETGKKRGQILQDVDTRSMASVIFCSLEGAIMTGKLNQSWEDMTHVICHLNILISSIEVKS